MQPLQRGHVGNVASGQEAAPRGEEIAQPEDLPIGNEEQPFVGAPCLHPQPSRPVMQQGSLQEGQQALIIEQEVTQCVLETLVNETNQVFCLGIGCIGISL